MGSTSYKPYAYAVAFRNEQMTESIEVIPIKSFGSGENTIYITPEAEGIKIYYPGWSHVIVKKYKWR